MQAMTVENGTSVTTMRFYYDANGTPVAFTHNGTMYLYITNLQGDIVGISDLSNGVGANYEYDAWGKLISTSSASSSFYTVMNDNPLRYRGYIYDDETGFYYLQSRYYDPVVRRFINEDSALYDGFLGTNLFAYCGNNPVNRVDHMGNSWEDFWSNLKEVGAQFVHAAIVVAAVGGAVLTVAAAVTGTVVSGGAGAIAIPAAIVVAAECLAVATATVAGVGAVAVVAGTIGENVDFSKIGENGAQTNSTTVWHGHGKERLDVENPNPGYRDGQIHYHDSANNKYMYDFGKNQFDNSTRRIQDLSKTDDFIKGLKKAFKILGEIWNE